MGMNIIVCRSVVGKDRERVAEWDSVRHSGDRDFYAEGSATAAWEQFDEDHKAYWRPDTSHMREWLANSPSVPEMNRPRLLALLDLIDRDPNVWVYGSF